MPKTLEKILIGIITLTAYVTLSYKTLAEIDTQPTKITMPITKKITMPITKDKEVKKRHETAVARKKAVKVKPEEMIPVEFNPTRMEPGVNYSVVLINDTQFTMKTENLNRVMSMKNKDYKTVIKELKTPLEAQAYCALVLEYEDDIKVYGERDYHASFKHIHSKKKDDCDGGAEATAAILSDNGFPPYVAILSNLGEKEVHEVFIFKTKKGKYCSAGKNIGDYQLFHTNIENLKEAIVKRIGKKYEMIEIYDFGKLFPDFIDNDKNNNINRFIQWKRK